MASTITLAAVDNWARPFIKQQPTSINNQEPALTTGNMVLQTILAAPFKWNWNRAEFTFTCVPKAGSTPAQFDYPVVINDFGYAEWAVIVDPSSGEGFSLDGSTSLPRPGGKLGQRPTGYAVQGDDGSGNIVFRLKEIPNVAYVVEGEYQKKAPLMQSLAFTFGPVPDEWAFVFNWGYLTIASLLVNDSRFPIYEKYFISRLLALHGGLDAVAMNLFVGNWTALTNTVSAAAMKTQQAIQARSV